MSDDENHRPPRPAKDGAAGGKLIGEDVFLSRLAARQEEALDLEIEDSSLAALEEALRSLGIAPADPAAGVNSGVRAMDRGQAMDIHHAPTAEDLAVEDLFMGELQAGRRPRLSDYLQRYPQQREALLRMAARMDPRELAGLTPPDGIAPEAQAAADRGVREGELQALRALTGAAMSGKRRRGRKVAEERGPYDAGSTAPAEGESRKPKTPRARRARPEDSGPER